MISKNEKMEEEIELEHMGLVISLLKEEFPAINSKSIPEIAALIQENFDAKCSILTVSEYFNPKQQEQEIGSEIYTEHGY